MNTHAVVMFLCTAMLVQVRELASDGGTDSERDRIALLAFKSNIKYDPQGVVNSWNGSNHFCEWQGVTCDDKHKRVTILNLSSRGLVGTLSPYIGNLSFLTEISLFNNTLQGKLPPEIGRLSHLAFLDLRNNSHEGEIPANLSRCSNLVSLGLSYNKFVGKFPDELSSLSKLKLLRFSYNNFIGGIPHSIGNLTSLELLYATNNKFVRTIPDIFHNLSNLTGLSLGSNEFDGSIPPSLYNLSQLIILSLPETRLHGNLPQNFGLLFPKLQLLQIRASRFTGAIPSSLSNATNLDYIEMGDNKFSGKVSVDFRHMKLLSNIDISNNTLGTGRPDDLDFLTSLLNCSYLDYMNIQRNSFGGALPDSVHNLSAPLLAYFIISRNRIYGRIPSWIGTFTNLESLGMHANKFIGSIPESLGQLQKLKLLYLYQNELSGHIPASLGNLTSMIYLSLYENGLNGTVPPSLGKCKNMQYLYMNQNSLSGNIPKQFFEMLALSMVDMSLNHFTGLLPSEVGGLKNFAALVIFDNEFSGQIPDSLGGCDSMQYLIMNNNFFNGSIPQALSSLRGLEAIDLSNNNLSGELPKYLETLNLTYLNLSFNNFEGEIPTKGIFTNISAVSLEGNKRLCGGVFELKFPICSVKKPNKRAISSLAIILITIVCLVLGVILLLLLIYFRFKRKPNVKASESEKTLMKVSYGMLYKATDGFSATNLLGLGSYGSVFKGILNPDEQIVAVKVLNLEHRGASKSFIAECEALRNIRHRNLVKTITSCSSVDHQGNDFKALVYEFMSKGNLDMWLHRIPESTTTSGNLNLLQRINIAIDIASAIDYLHHHCHLPIIHCDLKPSNILLDDDMIAHVGDFGIANFLQELSTPNQMSSAGIRGTIGYAPPEYGIGSAVSARGDVYSFGIVLLEMVTGKRPTDGMFEGGLNLHNFARLALSENVMVIVDQRQVLLNNEAEPETSTNISVVQASNVAVRDKCLISMISIGIACSMEVPQDRMNIIDAVRELHLARDILQQKKTIGNKM